MCRAQPRMAPCIVITLFAATLGSAPATTGSRARRASHDQPFLTLAGACTVMQPQNHLPGHCAKMGQVLGGLLEGTMEISIAIGEEIGATERKGSRELGKKVN